MSHLRFTLIISLFALLAPMSNAQVNPIRPCMKEVALGLTITRLATQPGTQMAEVAAQEPALKSALIKLANTYLSNRSGLVGQDSAGNELKQMINEVFVEIGSDRALLLAVQADLRGGSAEQSGMAIGRALGCASAFE